MAKALSFSPNSAKKVATKYGYSLSRVRSSVIFLRNPCQSPLTKLSRINFAASGGKRKRVANAHTRNLDPVRGSFCFAFRFHHIFFRRKATAHIEGWLPATRGRSPKPVLWQCALLRICPGFEVTERTDDDLPHNSDSVRLQVLSRVPCRRNRDHN